MPTLSTSNYIPRDFSINCAICTVEKNLGYSGEFRHSVGHFFLCPKQDCNELCSSFSKIKVHLKTHNLDYVNGNITVILKYFHVFKKFNPVVVTKA